MYAQKHMYKDIQCTTVYKIRNSNQKEELTTFWHIPYNGQQFPGGSTGKESAYNARDLGSIPGLGRSPGEGKRLPTPVFWPGEFQGLYSPWCCKESDTTE